MTVGLQSRVGASVSAGRDRIQVLVCTGDPGVEAGLVDAFAERGGVVQVVTDRGGYLAAAERDAFDAVLIDVPADPAADDGWRDKVLDDRVADGSVVLAVPADRENVALAAMDRGAIAYLVKPCTARQAAGLLATVAENRRLQRRLRVLEARRAAENEPVRLVGVSPTVRRLSGAVSRAGMNDATVLVEGKPGAGKSLVAELVHKNGRRANLTLLSLECEGLEESELEAALTRANGGTLVLEEVDRLPNRAQSRLVRYLKESSNGSVRDVRIVATTSARLAELTARGAFREDLYYRLNMFPIVVPALCERREDVPALARHFLDRSSAVEGLPDRGFTAGAMILLEAHPWPGNVAQLRQAVFRAHQLADGGPIDRVHLFGPSTGVNPPPDVRGLTDRLPEQEDDELSEDDIRPFQDEEKAILARSLKATKGNVRRAAQLLGIGRATLYRKIQIYQLRLH